MTPSLVTAGMEVYLPFLIVETVVVGVQDQVNLLFVVSYRGKIVYYSRLSIPLDYVYSHGSL